MSEPIATRKAYRDALVALMEVNDGIVCLDSDTGLFAGVDFGPAAARYANLGIAEQNLVGVAAGLAASGWTPYVNTMATFAATRALEAVKVDVALNALPVRIAATHGGLSAGHLGPTHHALEDVAVMRALPNMTVVVPADAAQTASLVAQTVDLPGPVYLRLGRTPSPLLGEDVPPPALGRLQPLRRGEDALIVACGPEPVAAALEAADELAAEGVSAAVLNASTVKPFDVETLCDAASPVRVVATIEDHWRAGGLGGAVAEALGERLPRRVLRLGMPDLFATVAGDHAHLLERYGVGAAALAAQVLVALAEQEAPMTVPALQRKEERRDLSLP
jgi:transketolase